MWWMMTQEQNIGATRPWRSLRRKEQRQGTRAAGGHSLGAAGFKSVQVGNLYLGPARHCQRV